MSKLRLFISVGICGILLTGCGFFDMFSSEMNYSLSVEDRCIPKDLVERLADKRYYDGFKTFYQSPENNFEHYAKRYGKIFRDDRYDDIMFKCDDLVKGYYNEAIKKYTDFSIKLPTNIKEELELEKEWFICDKMPLWLEAKLDEYIEQNKNDDIAYINASKFKGAWNGKLSDELEYKSGPDRTIRYIQISRCIATKTAIQAIENDLIDLGNGKKAKCADLSYDDAPKCLSYFVSVYDKTYKDKEKELKAEQKEINIKKERMKYEKINRQ